MNLEIISSIERAVKLATKPRARLTLNKSARTGTGAAASLVQPSTILQGPNSDSLLVHSQIKVEKYFYLTSIELRF